MLLKISDFIKDITLWICLTIINSVGELRKYLRKIYYMYQVPCPKIWPIIGNIYLARSVTKMETLFRLFRENGTIFNLWMGPIPFLFVSDPEINKRVLTNSKTMNKGALLCYITDIVLENTIVTTPVERWKRNRKMFNYAFSQQIVNAFLPIFNKASSTCVREMQKELVNSKAFDVDQYMSRLTIDAVYEAAMGVDFQQQATGNDFLQAALNMPKVLVEWACKPWLHPKFILKRTKLGQDIERNAEIMFSLIDKIFDDYWQKSVSVSYDELCKIYENTGQPVEKNPLKKSFLEFLIDLIRLNPDIMTVDDLKKEINFIILAGFETTASALDYTLLSIAALKNVHEQIYREIYDVFGNSNRDVHLTDLTQLKYLEMVIKESLRLFPSACTLLRNVSDDIQIGKYNIPAGTDIAISILYTHYNPAYWPNPTEFIPERFSIENSQNRHPFAFIPFSGGPRNCVGIKYAMMFMKTIIVHIVREYELDTDLDLKQLNIRIEMGLKLIGGHLIMIKKRRN